MAGRRRLTGMGRQTRLVIHDQHPVAIQRNAVDAARNGPFLAPNAQSAHDRDFRLSGRIEDRGEDRIAENCHHLGLDNLSRLSLFCRQGTLQITGKDRLALRRGNAGQDLEQAVNHAAALERGSMIHRLLQVLPGIAPTQRQTVLARYLERALPAEQAEARQIIEAQVMAVLGDPVFAPIFDAPGEAEVSVMGTLRVGGEERAVSGRIDRIALDGDRVLIVDYKTGLAPHPGEPPPSGHVSQLAIYRALLAPLYPDRRIEAALVYVSGPFLIEIPGSVLDQALTNLDP